MGLQALLAASAPVDDVDDDAPPPVTVTAVVPSPAPVAAVPDDDPTRAMLLLTFPGSSVVRVREDTRTPEQRAADERRELKRERQREAGRGIEVYVSRACNADAWGDVAGLLDPTLGWQLDVKATTRLLNPNGWAWYLQTRTPERPRPGKKTSKNRKPCCGNSKADVSPKRMALEGTTDEQRTRWLARAPGRGRDHQPNVAIVAGPFSGVLFVDSDTKDAERAATVSRIADEVLGITPYVRTRASAAKFARIYRYTEWDERLPSGLEWEGEDAIEVLGQGKSLTAHGRHHQANEPFMWSGPLPGMDEGATPDLAPVVTREQILEFLRRVAEECPGVVSKAARTHDDAPSEEGSGEVEVSTDGMSVPPLTKYPKVKIREARVVDGREAYTWEVVKSVIRLNRAECSEAQILAVVMAVLDRDMIYDEERSREDVLDDATEKSERALENKRSWIREQQARKGAAAVREREGVVTVRGVDVQAAVVPFAVQTHDADLDALVPGRVTLELPVTEPSDEAREARRLLTEDERKAQATRVAGQTRDPVVRWLDAVWDRARGVRKVPSKEMVTLEREAMRVVLLLGPTGSGKTTALLKCVKEQIDRRGKIGPLLFMAPSYGLLDEVVRKAGGGLSDAAERLATDLAVRDAQGLGLTVMVYQGKAKLCLRPEGKVLAAAGMSLQHMCETTETERVGQGPEATKRSVTKTCQFKKDGSCPAWSQLAEILTSDIVFLPTAFVSLPVPKELKACVALVVDESVAGRFLRTDSLALSSLRLPRREPTLSARDREAGLDADDMVQTRAVVNDVIGAAAERLMRDPTAPDIAEALLDATWPQLAVDPETGEARWAPSPRQRVEIAKNVVGRAIDTHAQIHPHLTLLGAERLASRETATDLWGEWRLHAVLLDRMEALEHDRLMANLHADALRTNPECPTPRRTARGTHDARIQVVQVDGAEGEVPTVRIRVSWRAKNSFAHLPTMLMDASASVDMVEKLWKGRDVVPCQAPARMHLRVVAVADRSYSDSSMQPWRHRAEAMRQGAAVTAHDVRRVVDTLAGMYGHSQIVVASTKGVEVSMHTAWVPPANASWLHYGAVVGLDFAKHFPAMVVIGRQELPHAVIDGIVGALTYDDDDPERPIDYLGTGVDREGNAVRTPAEERPIQMRGGHDVVVEVPTHVGKWARIVQVQAREEQLRQAIGRLRPVYREGEAPLVVVLGTCLPEDLVVDVVCGMTDLRSAAGLYARARETGGLLTTDRTARFGQALLHARPDGLRMSPAWEDMTARHLAGFVRYSYERDDGTEHQVDVLASADPLAAIARHEERNARTWTDTRGYVEVSRGRPLSDLRPREPDERMTRLVGTRDEQAAAEDRLLEQAKEGKQVTKIGRDGKALTTRSGANQTLTRAQGQVLLALASRPASGVNVNAAPVPVVEAVDPEVTEAANADVALEDLSELFAA